MNCHLKWSIEFTRSHCVLSLFVVFSNGDFLMTEYCHFHMAVTKTPGQTTYGWKYLSSVHHVWNGQVVCVAAGACWEVLYIMVEHGPKRGQNWGCYYLQILVAPDQLLWTGLPHEGSIRSFPDCSEPGVFQIETVTNTLSTTTLLRFSIQPWFYPSNLYVPRKWWFDVVQFVGL